MGQGILRVVHDAPVCIRIILEVVRLAVRLVIITVRQHPECRFRGEEDRSLEIALSIEFAGARDHKRKSSCEPGGFP